MEPTINTKVIKDRARDVVKIFHEHKVTGIEGLGVVLMLTAFILENLPDKKNLEDIRHILDKFKASVLNDLSEKGWK